MCHAAGADRRRGLGRLGAVGASGLRGLRAVRAGRRQPDHAARAHPRGRVAARSLRRAHRARRGHQPVHVRLRPHAGRDRARLGRGLRTGARSVHAAPSHRGVRDLARTRPAGRAALTPTGVGSYAEALREEATVDRTALTTRDETLPAAYSEHLDALSLAPLWTALHSLLPHERQTRVVAPPWRWGELPGPLLETATPGPL